MNQMRWFSTARILSKAEIPQFSTIKDGPLVYKEALDFISKAKEEALKSAKLYEAQSEAAADVKEKRRLAKLAKSQLISSASIDPEVQYRLRYGVSDFSNTAERLATENVFKKGPLAASLQRLFQMKIIPDLFGSIKPNADLRLYLGDNEVASGSTVQGDLLTKPVSLKATVFHDQPRTYHLIMVTPDVADPDTHSYSQKVHWFVPNISLSPSQNHVADQSSKAFVNFIPPLPEPGLPAARYAFILLASKSSTLNLPENWDSTEVFSTREFIKENHLTPVAVTFFRSEFDSTVQKLYESLNLKYREFQRI